MRGAPLGDQRRYRFEAKRTLRPRDKGADLTRGAPRLPPAAGGSRRFFIPRGESSAAPAAAPPLGRRGSAGRAAEGLKGGVGFNF